MSDFDIYCDNCGRGGNFNENGYPPDGWSFLVLDDVGGGEWECGICERAAMDALTRDNVTWEELGRGFIEVEPYDYDGPDE